MNIYVKMHMESGKDIVMELSPADAPNSVNSIVEMIDQDCYKDLAIQRIAPDFVLQPWFDEDHMDERFQYVTPVELKNNTLKFSRYAVGMAGNGAGESACGCFYIVAADGCEERLTGRFTPIGRVIEGFEEVDRIMQVETKDIDIGMEGVVVKVPLQPEIIRNMSYELNGYEPEKPEKKYRTGYLK